jgi:hypothetical protein
VVPEGRHDGLAGDEGIEGHDIMISYLPSLFSLVLGA